MRGALGQVQMGKKGGLLTRNIYMNKNHQEQNGGLTFLLQKHKNVNLRMSVLQMFMTHEKSSLINAKIAIKIPASGQIKELQIYASPPSLFNFTHYQEDSSEVRSQSSLILCTLPPACLRGIHSRTLTLSMMLCMVKVTACVISFDYNNVNYTVNNLQLLLHNSTPN